MLFTKDDLRLSAGCHVSDDMIYFDSSGAYVELSGVFSKVIVELYGKNHDYPAYISIIINGEEENAEYYQIKEGFDTYTLFESDILIDGSIKILKTTEEQYGLVAIKSLRFDGVVNQTEGYSKKILFIGDSITCGYGVDGKDGDVFTTASENFIHAYPYILSKSLHADYDTICSSGDGIISRYVESFENKPLKENLIPDMYSSWRQNDNHLAVNYDFIVINLGTNDASYTRNIINRIVIFKLAYKRFLEMVSSDYPSASIYVIYGVMENTLTQTIKDIVDELQKKGLNISFIDVALDGKLVGVAGHPDYVAQKQIAIQIERFI